MAVLSLVERESRNRIRAISRAINEEVFRELKLRDELGTDRKSDRGGGLG